MIAIYIAAFIFGGGLLALSAVFGGHDFSADGDFGMDHAEGPHHGPSAEGGELLRFLSMRNLSFFLAFGGLTGILLSAIGAGEGFTAVASVCLGLFSWYSGYRFMAYLRDTESSSVVHVSSLAGSYATVVVPPKDGNRGKVLVETHGNRLYMPALSSNTPEPVFAVGSRVLIISVQGGVAMVATAEE